MFAFSRTLKLAPVFLATALVAGCGESPYDMQRKPALVETLLGDADAHCPHLNGESNEAYRARLKPILDNTSSRALDILADNHVGVCLDTRLGKQVSGFFDRTILGVFYNASHRSISLWDDGRSPKDAGFFRMDAIDYGRDFLESFSEAVNDEPSLLNEPMRYGGEYTYACGKGCVRTEQEWRKPAEFSQSSISKNPALKVPAYR